MDIAPAFVARARHFLGTEYPAKIRRCLDALPEEALWARPAPGTNSVGNLLLHLAGNVRQWIVSGVGGAPDVRDRDAEFARDGGATRAEVWATLRGTLDEVDAVLARLDAAALLERRAIQGRDLTVLEAVFNVVEHFSMHTGQVILLAKLHVPGAIRFYDDAGGLARPLWHLGDETP